MVERIQDKKTRQLKHHDRRRVFVLQTYIERATSLRVDEEVQDLFYYTAALY